MSEMSRPDIDRDVARCPRGISTQEVLHREGRPVPPVFALESPRFLGSEGFPYARYTSQEFFNREMERMWPHVWQWACREEHIPEIGDYYVYDIGDYSIIVVRAKDGIRAYHNSCLHRGTKLRSSGTDGHASELRCPFHGWAWSLEGELTRLPCEWDLPHVNREEYRLPNVKVGVWGGFVFINMDENAAPLEDYIEVLPEHFEKFNMANRYIELHIEKEFACNWKSGWEAFVENYHTQETHPQLLTANYDEPTQYDIFGRHVSRFLSAYGISSPHLSRSLSERELIEEVLIGDRSLIDDMQVTDGKSARIVLAQMLREVLGKAYHVDLSAYEDTEMIDVAQYGLFPNMIVFPGLSLPLAYRVRPLHGSPDHCLFELMILREGPSDGNRPDPAPPVRLREMDSFVTVAGFDRPMAEVFDQDTGNLRNLQEGMKASRKPTATLTNYQEVRIRHLHQTLDYYLGEDAQI